MAEQPWCQSPARPAHGTALRGTAQRGHGQKPHRESSHGPKHVSNSFSSRLRGCTYTHTHSKGPRPKQQSPLGFSFIPWGQEMRICLQLSAKGLHSPAVLSSFQKQSAGTGWQCSPGHQVLSHSRIHSKKKNETCLCSCVAAKGKGHCLGLGNVSPPSLLPHTPKWPSSTTNKTQASTKRLGSPGFAFHRT